MPFERVNLKPYLDIRIFQMESKIDLLACRESSTNVRLFYSKSLLVVGTAQRNASQHDLGLDFGHFI